LIGRILPHQTALGSDSHRNLALWNPPGCSVSLRNNRKPARPSVWIATNALG